MSNNALRFVAVLAIGTAVACGDTVAPVTADAIVGTWGRANQVVTPGEWLYFTLARNNVTVTGSGNWAGEAAPFGKVSVDGTIVSDSVHLTLTFTYDTLFHGLAPYHAVFDGRFASTLSLVGSITYDGQSKTSETFAKQCIGPTDGLVPCT